MRQLRKCHFLGKKTRLQMPWENGFAAGTSLAIEALLVNYLPLTGQLLVTARSTFIT